MLWKWQNKIFNEKWITYIFTHEKYNCLSAWLLKYVCLILWQYSFQSKPRFHAERPRDPFYPFKSVCFSLPFRYFFMCRLTIVKIGDTTNILYKPRFHADRSRGVIDPTDTSCLPFSIDFRVIYYFTCIKRALIRNSLWQPRFHAGILV